MSSDQKKFLRSRCPLLPHELSFVEERHPLAAFDEMAARVASGVYQLILTLNGTSSGKRIVLVR